MDYSPWQEPLPGETIRRGISETGMIGWEVGAVLLRPEVLLALEGGLANA